ncbi:hypothetical protein Tco_0849686 [Tanacetum coccineum]
MYNNKKVDYAFLLWEDLTFQIESKKTKKVNLMYYPRFTKLIVNFIMSKDPAIPRRNKVNWHYARNDPMFTTLNVISRNEVTQLYGAILPVELTNEEILNSESYKEYYAFASGKVPPKQKASVPKKKTDSETTIMKTSKKTRAEKQKQTAGLETLSETALTEAEQLKIVTKRSRLQTHSSYNSGSGADEGTGITPGVPDVPNEDSEDEISWKSSGDDKDDDDDKVDKDSEDDDEDDNEDDNDDDDDDINEDGDNDDDEDSDAKSDDDAKRSENDDDNDDDSHTESEHDGGDFVHPKITTHDEEMTLEEEVNEEDNFDYGVRTPSHVTTTDDDDDDKEVQGANVEGEKLNEETTHVEDQGNEADRDTNVNLEGRGDDMTDVVLPQVQATQEIEDTHVTLTPVNPDGQQQSSSVSSGFISNMMNPNQDVGIEAIFGPNTEANSLVEIPVTAIAEPSFLAPTLTPLFTQLQQTPILTLTTIPSSSLQNLPNFDSLFGFDHRLKALEDNFSEFKQSTQVAETLSSIPGIIDQYLANKIKEVVDVAVQLKADKIREDAQAENQQFLDSIDKGMKKVIKEHVKQQVKSEVSKIMPKIEKLVNEQLEFEVLIRSLKEAKTSHAVAANLSELELKKILINKMEANRSIDRSDTQKNLYKALVDVYEADKLLLDTYGDTVTLKRCQDGADDDQEPSAGTDRGSTPVEEPMHTTADLEEPTHQEYEIGVNDEQQVDEAQPLPDWFKQPERLPSPDRDWNKSVPADHGSVQPWLSKLASKEKPRESFDELTDTTFDFSASVMNRLNVTELTPELLAGPTFELMKGTCKSLTELEYFYEEVYKATTEQLDWTNPKGKQYPHDLRKPLSLIPNPQGQNVIPFHHFINNDLEYLRGGVSSQTYSTSVMKTKAADYGNIKWIEDLVPTLMWSNVLIKYNKQVLWGISHWGKKRQRFYAFAASRESARDVYSKHRIIVVVKLEIVEWQNYKHLDWIMVRRSNDELYKFKEGDFHRLRIQDIEDMLLLLIQGKLTNLSVEERLAFNVSLRMFTRSVVIQRRVEDLQLGVESYQKKLNLMKPDTYRSYLKRRDAYSPHSNPRGFIYQNNDKKHRLMRIDELHKFSDGTLNDVRTALNDRLKGIWMEYLPQTMWGPHDKANARSMLQAIEKQFKTRRIMRSLERFIGGRPYGGDLRLLQMTI